MKVFLLEDEAFVAMDMEDLLTEAGHEVIGPAMSLPEAERVLTGTKPDFAIVDANIRGEAPVGIVEELIRRRIPYVYVSGYAEEDIKRALPDGPFVPKPIRYEHLEEHLSRKPR